MWSDTPQRAVNRNEGVLCDVLDELDLERTKRAALESEIQKLKEKQDLNIKNNKDRKMKQAKNEVSEQELIALTAMKTERNGFREIVDALTESNKAISAATENGDKKEKSLPVHVVRMLEVMPYDPRVIYCAKAKEEVYEWQVHKSGKWQHLLRYFPPIMKKLPIVQPKDGSAAEDSESRKLFPELPPKHCVLTNDSMNKILNLDKGYSLPQNGGTWEWVSGWLVDKHAMEESSQRTSKRSKIDCDADGWSYAEEPHHFITSPAELCWDEPVAVRNNNVKRPYRRRRWTRQRALRSYPHASQTTMQYLRLLSENSRLSVTNTKLSDQLVETKTKLTEVEATLVSANESATKERTDLQHAKKKIDEVEAALVFAREEMEMEKERERKELERELKKQKEEKKRKEEMQELEKSQKQVDKKVVENPPPKQQPRKLSFHKEKPETSKTEEVKPETNNVVENIVSKEKIEKMRSAAGDFASSLVSSASNAASNAFRKASEDRTKNTDGDEKSDSSATSAPDNQPTTENRSLDWKMIGRGLSEKLSPAGAAFLQGLGRKPEEQPAAQEENQKDGDLATMEESTDQS